MAGISSKALNNAPENRTKFQGQEFANKEFSDGSGLDWYEFKYRMHDPQIGRFIQIDPLASDYVYNSPYAFSENQVTNNTELEGLEKGPPRYMSPSFYAQQRRSYREINAYVPNAQSYRNSGTYIPNQSAGSAPTPYNAYEPGGGLGSGDQHTGPTVTRGNTQGELAVKMTELVDDLKSQIERVTVTTTNIAQNDNSYSTSSGIQIEWKNKDAEKSFNALQGQYDQKVKDIQDNNKLPAFPGANASKEDLAKWGKEVMKVSQTLNMQMSLLGPSPTQQIMGGVNNTMNYKLTSTSITPLPEIRRPPINNTY